jgi:predicted nucleic acid-binding protein
MIAAIAVANRAALATRNIDDFAGLDAVREVIPLSTD